MSRPIVHTLSIPNPFFEGRNSVYVIACDPVTLIDTGIATSRAYDALIKGLAEHDLTPRDIRRVLLTHKHIDHIGSAWRIQRETGAEVRIFESEVHALDDVDPIGKKFGDLVRERLREWHVPEAMVERPDSLGHVVWEIEPCEVKGFRAGDHLPTEQGPIEVIHTPGHTAGSVCLKFGTHLFTGDHVLPDMSPNIGAGDVAHRGLLALFLRSLRRVIEIAPEIELAMPGHGQPFADLEARCVELIRHHEARLDQIRRILSGGGAHTVFDVADRLFGEMRDFHLMLGCAEAYSHVEYLEESGEVASEGHRYRVANS